MKTIVINDCNLNDEEMEQSVIRVKGLIINSSGKILLAHNNNTYQFPGGHKEDEESIDDCVLREIMEETGIKLEIQEPAFLCIKTYDDNYFGTNKKVVNSIYYYRFFTDDVPHFENTHYDELELATDFNLFYVEFSELKNFLTTNMNSGNIDPKICREMLLVVDEYSNLFGG